jgi:hypothetical protein
MLAPWISRLHGPGDAHRDRQLRRSHLSWIIEQKLLLVNLCDGRTITLKQGRGPREPTEQDIIA